MIRVLTTCMFLAGAAAASQVFHMDLPAVVSMADTVLLAKILSVEEIPGLYGVEVRFELRPLNDGEGTLPSDSLIHAAYFREYPRSYRLEDGSEIWESPLVSGSGVEMTCGTGDTVTVLLAGLTAQSGTLLELLRMEPADSFGEVQGLAHDRNP